MNYSVVRILIIVLIISAAGAGVYYMFNLFRQEKALAEDERTVEEFDILAEGGKFTPSEINTKHFRDLDLVIKAGDGDYVFKVEDYPRFDTEIKQGQTAKIELYTLGVGEYNYVCGPSCGGKIIVEQKSDEE